MPCLVVRTVPEEAVSQGLCLQELLARLGGEDACGLPTRQEGQCAAWGTARRRGGKGGRGRKKSQGRDAPVTVNTEEDGTGLSGREEWRKR